MTFLKKLSLSAILLCAHTFPLNAIEIYDTEFDIGSGSKSLGQHLEDAHIFGSPPPTNMRRMRISIATEHPLKNALVHFQTNEITTSTREMAFLNRLALRAALEAAHNVSLSWNDEGALELSINKERAFARQRRLPIPFPR